MIIKVGNTGLIVQMWCESNLWFQILDDLYWNNKDYIKKGLKHTTKMKMVMMVSAIVSEVLRRRKEREGVGDVCCYSFGLGQCSNAKYTKSLYNFLSDILFILNQSNVFCVLFSGCLGNNLLTTSVICAPTFLLITLRWPLFKGASYRAGEASLEKKCWQTVCWGQNVFVLRIIFSCDT